MATMVKEKRREKKKPKEKHVSLSSKEREELPILEEKNIIEQSTLSGKVTENIQGIPTTRLGESPTEVCSTDALNKDEIQSLGSTDNAPAVSVINKTAEKNKIDIESDTLVEENIVFSKEPLGTTLQEQQSVETIGNTYQDLNDRLERIIIPGSNPNIIIDELENRLDTPNAYIGILAEESSPLNLEIETDKDSFTNTQSKDFELSQQIIETEVLQEVITPSAPLLEEGPVFIEKAPGEECSRFITVKTPCLPLEEAIGLYGGEVIAEVKAMSEKEECIVEAGAASGPDHPLVDLLSTFRSSLRAVERERAQLACSFTDEEKSRNTLWKIKKLTTTISEKCPCGLDVQRKLIYEHAELQKARLPVAKMKLESLLRDVQESYCHHQHAALLAHCQIEELISETIQCNKHVIREALALVLQSLRLSDSAPAALAVALQRWAAILSAALLNGRDLRQLLHLIHHLFRQTRSVRWAARVMHVTIGDRTSAAQTIALLDLLLARPRLEPALECTEDTEEIWEEVDEHGASSAVSEGTLREGDLIQLLRIFPLRDLAARLVLFTHSDIKQARDFEWGDTSGGHGVLRSCCGIRALLYTLQRATLAHPHYTRLHARLRSFAAHTLHALAALHMHTSYSNALEDKISAEMEACFAAGVLLCNSQRIHSIPTTLLPDDSVKDYCVALMVGLHDNTPKRVESLSIELPVLPCEERIRILAHAAIDRTVDHDLARMVLDFLFQTGIKRKTVQCKGTCDVTAREMIPRLLAVHPYLHTMAFHIFADLNQVEQLDPSLVQPLSVDRWRPSPQEVTAVLTDWAQRCPLLLQHLLLLLDCTSHCGLSLETQLTIGTYLCRYQQNIQPTPEWLWKMLRRLKVHRTSWHLPIDAPPPDPEPSDLFSTAYAVLASSWGHCVPLICSEGVTALCRVATARPCDAIHCLAPIMLVMAHSPESISFTPKFNDLFTTMLNSGPTMVQRALGRGPVPGSELLLRLMLSQIDGKKHATVSCSAILSAWQHGVWRVTSPAALLMLDTALLFSREWTHFDAFAQLLMQEENANEHISHALRNAATAPLICECVLRAAHAVRETRAPLAARVLDALHLQRVAGDRIHVDNALKNIGASISSEELVIYRTATAALTAPPQHPAHLTLWRLFMHLYLQRPPCSMLDSTPPVGQLFFSGLIKSRTLAQLKKRLLETVTYHINEAAVLKQELHEESKPKTSNDIVETRPERQVKYSEDSVLPTLTIQDLTGDSSESEDSSQSEEERDSKIQQVQVESVQKKDVYNLMCYHIAAEKMIREYLRWVDEGENTRAMPHHADIARFISEQALEAAWKHELSRRRPLTTDEECSPPPTPSDPPPLPLSPFQTAVGTLLKIKDRSRNRSRKPSIRNPLENVNFKDARALLSLVEKHLTDIETLAQEWSKEVSRISALDAALWELVCSLRVSRPLPVVKQSCAKKCKPVNLVPKEREWCISTGAERGIKENRRLAIAGIRRLARPRPHAASCAATLHTMARRVSSSETARRVCSSAWRSARVVAGCAPARAALTALVELLAERWICHDPRISCDLLSQWSSDKKSSSLQQSLCGALVSPRRLAPKDWPTVYIALLRSELPEHVTFSYLSKFEMAWWVTQPDVQRREVLEALVAAAQRFGSSPRLEQHVLLELVGVHTAILLSPAELCAHIMQCARASVAGSLPPTHWPHVSKAAEVHARRVSFDQLGHLLRELGVLWWEARSQLKGKKKINYEMYAPCIADLLRSLQRAFVAAAVALSYAPDRVALYAWSSLLESWSAWVSPHAAAAPLLTSTGEREAYTPMLRHFVDDVHQIMLDCPGTEERLLQQIFDWTVQTYVAVNNSKSQESSVQLSALLVELRNLPWTEHQWMCGSSLQIALQIAASTDKEITLWCSSTWKTTTATTWLRDVTDDTLAPRLAALLYLFSSMTHSPQTLEEATYLPWWRLPGAALDEAFDRFFALYHNPAIPYHEVLQFRVLLYASELSIHPESPPPHICSASSRLKRSSAVSLWVRAACAPTVTAHVSGHSNAVLNTLTEIAPHVQESENEIEELLGRAVIIMCMEPAAAAALPIWLTWVLSTTARMIKACISAVSILTTFEYFAALSDAAVRAHLVQKESTGWSEITLRWQSCHWTETVPLAARARLHAAYAVLRTHTQTYEALRTTFMALLAATINFAEEEVIIATWICAAGRVARECPSGGDAGECAGAARTLLTRWADDARRSLLRVVTLQTDKAAPTPQHRLLCRLALCIVSNNDSTIRAYETACSSTLGSNHDVLSWGRNPHPKRLPRLAVRLYPTAERYFKDELDMAPETA